MGVGKEADVYEALTPEGELVAVKFHRLGRTSFRQTARVRSYLQEKAFWFIRSKVAARKEYEALKTLYRVGVAVTKPRAHNRHAILMDKITGTLYKIKELPEPRKTLQKILENIALAYKEAGINPRRPKRVQRVSFLQQLHSLNRLASTRDGKSSQRRPSFAKRLGKSSKVF